MRIFRDDSLPPDVLCMLVTDGADTAIVTNGAHVATAPGRVREAINTLLAECCGPALRAAG